MQAKLLATKALPDFPSASAINFREGHLYIIGDDATHILVLDRQYSQVKKIILTKYAGKQIPKNEKMDLEAAFMLAYGSKASILTFGSGSKKLRRKYLSLEVGEIHDSTEVEIFENNTFIQKIKSIGIAEVNIEGATLMDDSLILSNRGNRSHPENFLIRSSLAQLRSQDNRYPTLVKFSAGPLVKNSNSGISDISYLPSLDCLVIILSTEDTDNALDDGAIGESYVGVINNFKLALETGSVCLSDVIKLSDVDIQFLKEKIEGICIEFIEGSTMTVHLVSDNDDGESKIFKLSLSISAI